MKWLKETNRVKRWILLTLIGMTLVCYGFSEVLVLEQLYFKDIFKIVVIFVLGFTCAILGLVYIHRRTLELAVKVNADTDTKTNTNIKKLNANAKNIKDIGPNIVVIGGGTGLNNVLKGLKNYTNNLTAIITVSTYGSKVHKPTEDIKSGIIALAQNTEEMQKIMKYEFKDSRLNGLDFGDLYLLAAQEIYGDFTKSIEKSGRILSMIGRALPVTLDEMRICAELENGMVIEDKEQIAKETANRITKINRVYISPSNCRVAPGVIEAIQSADAIIIGPGNLYTNVIPNLLIKNVAKTIKESKAFKIYISNIMTEPGLTDDYDLSEHLQAIEEHAGKGIIDYCICDNGEIIPEFLRKYNKEGANLVQVDTQNLKGVKIIKADISCIDGEYIRHDSDALAKEIIELICNELRFKDKQNEEQYILLNSKLKEKKQKEKLDKKFKIKPKRLKEENKIKSRYKKQSKFAEKYKDRIESIQNSEETRLQNIKIQEQANKMAKEAEKQEKRRYLNDDFKKNKK